MERRVILFTTIAALGGILFLVGYNNRGEEEAEKGSKKTSEIQNSSVESILLSFLCFLVFASV